ncbi:MAG: ISNCY family transposase [Gemmatimonadota bacterium]|nr:ISNCY family transposase [Gemmatimonadota bacterium]
MSERELRRGEVISRVVSGELTSVDASELLGLSTRQVKRVLKPYRAGGVRALVHRNFGRASNRARPTEERERVLELVAREYGGSATSGPGQRFGPTLVAEHLLEDQGLVLAVSTLTDWMRSIGLWTRRRKRRPHRLRRERKAHFAELVQLDGSFHDWLEGRGPRGCLMTMTDDAMGTVLARLGKEETLWAAIAVLRGWIKKYGVPRALYTDWKNLYHLSAAKNSALSTSQFGRICRRLGIELIAASSPQAKGRVERTHGTSQDRLVKKLRLRGISTFEGVNDYLEESYLSAHNARFARRAASSADYHLRLDPRLDNGNLWCREETRSVSSDGVIAYKNRRLSLTLRRDMPPRARVLVRENEEGALRVIYKTPGTAEYELTWKDYLEPKPLYRAKGVGSRAEPHRPRAEHPWRRTNMIFSIKP